MFNFLLYIKFGVIVFIYVVNDQMIDIYIDDDLKLVVMFKGVGVQDQNFGMKVFDFGNGCVCVIVMVNGRLLWFGLWQVDIFKKLYFGIIGLEDGVDDDYNDGIVFLNWLLG